MVKGQMLSFHLSHEELAISNVVSILCQYWPSQHFVMEGLRMTAIT